MAGDRRRGKPGMGERGLRVAGLYCLRGVALAVAFGCLAGCARLAVTSDPPGAAVLWSPDGLEPWRPWPPLHWTEYGPSGDQGTTVTTPMSRRGPQGEYLFVRVEKPGYYAPRPRLAGMRALRTCQLDFTLQERPEHFAEQMKEKGLVYFESEWVDPKARGLVEYKGEWMTAGEREKKIKAAEGLVEYEGKWMTPAEYESEFASRQRARGLVEFKSRWVRPEVRAEEETVDQAVTKIRAVGPMEMLPPKVLGRIEGSLSWLGVMSHANAPTRWLISGPSSRWFDLPPQGQLPSAEVKLIPGRYTIAIFTLPASGVAPSPGKASPTAELLPAEAGRLTGLMLLVEMPLSSGFQYSLAYTPPASPAL